MEKVKLSMNTLFAGIGCLLTTCGSPTGANSMVFLDIGKADDEDGGK